MAWIKASDILHNDFEILNHFDRMHTIAFPNIFFTFGTTFLPTYLYLLVFRNAV